jgi:hypothetical protein
MTEASNATAASPDIHTMTMMPSPIEPRILSVNDRNPAVPGSTSCATGG